MITFASIFNSYKTSPINMRKRYRQPHRTLKYEHPSPAPPTEPLCVPLQEMGKVTLLKMKQEAEEKLRRLQEDKVMADLTSGMNSSLLPLQYQNRMLSDIPLWQNLLLGNGSQSLQSSSYQRRGRNLSLL